MTVKEIIRTTAVLLGKEYVVKEIDEGGDNVVAQKEISQMVTLCNLVVSELARRSFPVTTLQTLSSPSKTVKLIIMRYNVVELIEAYDVDGNTVAFTLDGDVAYAEREVYKIKYSYEPPVYALNDDVDFIRKYKSLRVFSYGLASEVCMTESRFREASLWRKKFEKAVADVVGIKNFKIKPRYWS